MKSYLKQGIINQYKMRIRSAYPSISNLEVSYVKDAIKNGWGIKRNLYTDRLIKYFSKYLNLKYILPVINCTSAIHLALLSAGIKKGDEVIVPDLTWISSASPLLYIGAIPVFVDVDENTLCIDSKKIEKAINKKTKAIIAVDLLGNMPRYKVLKKISKKYNLVLIEDAAESIGAKFKGEKAGTFGEVSVFSFNATKLVMSGQGGVLATNNKKIYLKAKNLSNHGIDRELNKKYYWTSQLGFNYNITNLQSACAYAQVKRINELIRYKKKIYKLYKKHFKNIKNVKLTSIDKYSDQTFWIVYAVLNKKINKEKICDKFKKYKIDMRPMFYLLSSMPIFNKRNSIKKINPVAKNISQNSLCLPNGYDLNENKIKYIASIFKKVVN